MRRLVGVGTVAAAHAVNDTYTYILPAMLPVLMPGLGISLAMAGLLVTLQQLTASFIQPVFGHLADRSQGGRWMAWTGIALSGLSAAYLGYAGGFGGLALAMLVNGMGTALFHPVSASLVAASVPASRRGFWMSVYVTAGNLGLASGPLGVSLLLERGGLANSWLLAVPSLLMALIVWRWAPHRAKPASGAHASLASVLRRHRRVIGTLVAVVAVRAWAQAAFVAFLPLLAAARGADASQAAQVLAVYLAVGALGGFAGGAVADRLGRDRVIVGSMLLSVPFGVLVALQESFGPLFVVAAAVAGLLLSGSWVVLTVRGQESVPGSIGMMSGLMLGLSIGLGGLAVAPLAALAEVVGLAPVLLLTSTLPAVGAALMRLVPKPPAYSSSGG